MAKSKTKEDISGVVVSEDPEEEKEIEEVQEEKEVKELGESSTPEEGKREPKQEISEEEKQALEALSPEEREILQDEDARFVDGTYRVPLARVKKLTAKIKESDRRLKDTETALSALKFQYRDSRVPPPQKRYTAEELEEIRTYNPTEAERIVSHQTYHDLNEQERMQNFQQGIAQRFNELINEANAEAISLLPAIDPQAKDFDRKVHDEVTQYAVRKGWLTHNQQGQPLYLRHDAFLAAIKEMNLQQEDNQRKQNELNETIRQSRLKKSTVEKADGRNKSSKVSNLTKAQIAHCKKHGINPEIYANFVDREEAQV